MSKSLTKRVQKVVYPGELGQHGLIGQLAWQESLGSGHAPGKPEFLAEFMRRKADQEWRMLELLSTHYGIGDASSEEAKNIAPELRFGARFLGLALRFARQYVPAFDSGPVARRGRPPKKNALARLRDAYSRVEGEKKRGRPSDPKRAEELRGLLKHVVRICNEKGFRKRGQIKLALEYDYAEVAKENRMPVWRVRRALYQSETKRISEAKRLFPEIAAKLPR